MSREECVCLLFPKLLVLCQVIAVTTKADSLLTHRRGGTEPFQQITPGNSRAILSGISHDEISWPEKSAILAFDFLEVVAFESCFLQPIYLGQRLPDPRSNSGRHPRVGRFQYSEPGVDAP